MSIAFSVERNSGTDCGDLAERPICRGNAGPSSLLAVSSGDGQELQDNVAQYVYHQE
jgi:hypothetical protein